MKLTRIIVVAASFAITYCLMRIAIYNTKQLDIIRPQFVKVRLFTEDTVLLTQTSQNSGSLSSEQFRPRNSKCSQGRINWSIPVKPKYQLNPTKFLVPMLMNGPNNQMMGFQQSILFSLLLNRTLVLPKFYQHEIDRFFRTIVPVENRLNIQKLREFITVLPLQQAIKLCNSKIDAIFADKAFRVKKKGLADLVRFSMETGFSAVNYNEDVGNKDIQAIKKYLYSEKELPIEEKFREKAWWPKNRTEQAWTQYIVRDGVRQSISIFPKSRASPDVGQVTSLYSTEAKCVLHWFPFRQYTFRQPVDAVMEEQGVFELRNISGDNGWKLQSDILMNTRPPEAIFAWSRQFQRKHICISDESKYMAIHWRFDEKDFFGYICRDGLRQSFCEDVRRASNASMIATAILRKISFLNTKRRAIIGAIYIAAPPTLDYLINGVLSKLGDKKFVRSILNSQLPIPKVYTSKELKHFILQEYRDCAMARPKQLSDTISQIEMDICAMSFSFFWSRQSTWSINVKHYRFFNGRASQHNDFSILDSVLETMQVSSTPYR